jgi:CRISP-associated protein Cas1
MQIILNTHGIALKVKDGVFYITDGTETRMVSPEKITSIAITAACSLSSTAIELATDSGIPIYIFDHTGEVKSVLRSPYFESLATLRRKQVYFSDHSEASVWLINMFQLKTDHQLHLLQWLSEKHTNNHKLEPAMQQMQADLAKLPSTLSPPNQAWNSSLMGWEGNQARRYWQAIGKSVPIEWQFKGRSRRPAQDAFNALINYGYGMLYSKVEQALFAAGLDPHLGILHADEYDRPTLSYDLIEPFRPWLDRLIVEKIVLGEVLLSHCDQTETGVLLNTAGKRYLIPVFNGWLLEPIRWQQRQMTREAHIFFAAATLAKLIQTTIQRPK